MPMMGSSRNMQTYLPMNSYSHFMSPSLPKRAPGMEMTDSDPSRLSLYVRSFASHPVPTTYRLPPLLDI